MTAETAMSPEITEARLLFTDEQYSLLTPEWREYAKNFLLPRGEFNQPAYITHPDIIEYAVKNSGYAREFAETSDYPDPIKHTDKFKKLLTRQIGLYRNLGPIHKTESFTESLADLVFRIEQWYDPDLEEITVNRNMPADARRIRANILEELGLFLKDYDLLELAINENEEIYNGSEDSGVTQYKFHAPFSKYDIAWSLLNDAEGLNRLHLPVEPATIICRQYQELEKAAENALNQTAHLKEDTNIQITGVTAEQVVLLYIRGEITKLDEAKYYDARLSYIRQDSGNHRLEHNTPRLDVLSPSYDISVTNRDDPSEQIQIDVKKGKGNYGNMNHIMPNVKTIRTKHSGLTDKEYLGKVRDYARTQKRYWQDSQTDAEYFELKAFMEKNLGIADDLIASSQQLGKIAVTT